MIIDNVELKRRLKTAGSEAEFKAILEEEGINLSDEDIENAFASINREGEIEDDDLDSVSGGGCSKEDYTLTCPRCGTKLTYVSYSDNIDARTYYLNLCYGCRSYGVRFRNNHYETLPENYVSYALDRAVKIR